MRRKLARKILCISNLISASIIAISVSLIGSILCNSQEYDAQEEDKKYTIIEEEDRIHLRLKYSSIDFFDYKFEDSICILLPGTEVTLMKNKYLGKR